MINDDLVWPGILVLFLAFLLGGLMVGLKVTFRLWNGQSSREPRWFNEMMVTFTGLAIVTGLALAVISVVIIFTQR